MKAILLDENVPRRLRFTPTLPLVGARAALGGRADDADIWDYARDHGCVILTRDADFSYRMLDASPPPWVVHLRLHNMRAADFHHLLAGAWPRVEALLPDHKLVTVYPDRIEAVR